MKPLALLIWGFAMTAALVGFGIGVAFVAGAMVTILFHASDTGLGIFLIGSCAWVAYLFHSMLASAKRAMKG